MSAIRSAAALAVNGGLASVLGLAYWFLAARLYPVADVGRNASLISALLLLSALAQLNYSRSLTFLLPAAGHHGTRVLFVAYRRCALLALVGGGAYVLLAPHVGADLAYLGEGWLPLLFAVSVSVWVVFSLQDAALTAVDAAHVVPFENLFFGMAKLGLLLAFWRADSLAFGIFASWMLPLLLCVPAVTVILWRRMRSRTTWSAASPVERRSKSLWLDAVGYYVYLCGTAPLPILVLTILGPVAAATYYLPATVASTVELLGFAVGNVLTADLTKRHGEPNDGSRRLVRVSLLAVCALAATCAAAAAKMLALLGPDYERGVVLLVCFACAAPPRTVLIFRLATLRAQQRGEVILVLHTLTVVVTLGAMLVLTVPLGLDGLGYGWLLGSVVGAVAATASSRVPDRLRRPAATVR